VTCRPNPWQTTEIVVHSQVHEFYEAAFQEAIGAGTTVYAVDVGSRLCMEIDTLEDLERARELVACRGGATGATSG
jgi:choline kinase